MDSKDDRSHQLIAVAAAFIALVTISVALRTYTRLRMAKTLGADDWLIIAALVGSGALSGGTIIGTHRLRKKVGTISDICSLSTRTRETLWPGKTRII